MSHTVSPGLMRSAHWVGVAASVAEYLKPIVDGKEPKMTLPKGALRNLRQFFVYVLAGIEREQTGQARENIPPMADISNLSIAIRVFVALEGTESALVSVAVEARVYWRILTKLYLGYYRLLTSEEIDRTRRLYNFSTELMRDGQRDAEAERFENNGDED